MIRGQSSHRKDIVRFFCPAICHFSLNWTPNFPLPLPLSLSLLIPASNPKSQESVPQKPNSLDLQSKLPSSPPSRCCKTTSPLVYWKLRVSFPFSPLSRPSYFSPIMCVCVCVCVCVGVFVRLHWPIPLCSAVRREKKITGLVGLQTNQASVFYTLFLLSESSSKCYQNQFCYIVPYINVMPRTFLFSLGKNC